MTYSKISSTEAVFMIVTVIVAHTLSSLPQNLINNTKSSTIINLIYVGFITIFISYIIYRLLKNFASEDIIDISEYLGGTVFKSIVGVLFLFYFIFSSASLLREFCEGLHIVFFPMTNTVFIIIPFIFVMIINNLLSFGSNAKAISVVFPIVLASVVFLFVCNLSHFSFQNIYPILGKGFVNTFITGIGNIGAFGGISCLYFLPPFLKQPDKMKNICLLSVIIGTIYLVLSISTILLIFSIFVGAGKVLPFYSAARYIEFGTFFQRLESIFLLIWIMVFASYLSITLKFSTYIFQKITLLTDTKILIPVLGLLLFGIALLPNNLAISQYYEAHIYPILMLGISIFLSLSILIFANIFKKGVNFKK